MGEAAVIDVGSNSVRLVAYRLDGRALTPFLNEKVMAGLGRNVAVSGRLSPESMDTALKALRRFRVLIEGLGIKLVLAVATAAVRDAADGPAFADRVTRETGFRLRVLSGEEEARLSALGVLAGAPDARGVVGDLGGASLELVAAETAATSAAETWPLGPFALMGGGGFDPARVALHVDDFLARSAVLRAAPEHSNFYAVGGAWRALGRIDQSLRNHPLHVLHHHEISSADVLKVAEFVRRQGKRSLEKLEEPAAKRAETLPYAAVVLERVMHWGGFEKVILSSYGLREGLLAERFSEALLAEDPLIAGAEAFGATTERSRTFGRALGAWIEPVFAADAPVFGAQRDKVLRQAAARLSDLGGALHPDHRGEIMFDMVLRAPFAGITHVERAYLAAALHHRHNRSAPHAEEAYDRLLNEDQRRAAAALGAALRLGADLSGRSERILRAFTLSRVDGVLALATDHAHSHLLIDLVSKRLDPLSALLGLQSRIVMTD